MTKEDLEVISPEHGNKNKSKSRSDRWSLRLFNFQYTFSDLRFAREAGSPLDSEACCLAF